MDILLDGSCPSQFLKTDEQKIFIMKFVKQKMPVVENLKREIVTGPGK